METRVSVKVVLAIAFAASSTSLVTRSAFAAAPSKKECVEANESAQDLRRENKLRDARTRLAVCLSATCPGPVREDCAHRLAEVEAAAPTLVLVATDAAGNDLSSVRVTLDGQPFIAKLDGKAMAVDPGEHRFAFEASGLPATETTVVVHEGEKDRRVKVVLAPPPAVEVAPPPSPPMAPPAPTGGDGTTQRTLGLVLGGVGILGLVGAGVLDIVAKMTFDNAKQTCANQDPNKCPPQAVTDGNQAHDELKVATIAGIAGGALLATGAILFFTAPKENRVSAGLLVYERGAGLGLQGTW